MLLTYRLQYNFLRIILEKLLNLVHYRVLLSKFLHLMRFLKAILYEELPRITFAVHRVYAHSTERIKVNCVMTNEVRFTEYD